MEVTLYLRVQTTRTQRDITTESEYAIAVTPLRGRLSVDLDVKRCIIFIKLDGWPEVNMDLEGVRNNAEGRDEEQLQEILREELTAALRKVTLELDLSVRKTFPRFSRQRTLPDHVMPVGYDALVRERQTFPPSFETKIPASRTPIPLRAKTKGAQAQPKSSANVNEEATLLTPPPIPERGRRGTQPGSSSPQTDRGNLLPEKGPVQGLLTESEESLVRRNLEEYRDDLAKGSHSPQRHSPEGFPPPGKSSLEARSSSAASASLKRPPAEGIPGRSSVSRSSMVFSSREKPIDEPNGPASPAAGDEEEEIGEEELFLQKMKEGAKSHGRTSPKSKSPAKDFEFLKESLKETIRNNPFSKHLPGGTGGGTGGGGGALFAQAATSHSNAAPVGIVGLNGKRLLVKVVKATSVGGETGVSACFAVVEMDEPPQKFSTNVVKDTSSPFWDEQFLFDLSDNTLELLFELYDKTDGRFVGLGIVGIEELVATPSQRQIIPLQARPYEKDQVSGSLTCEFLFLDRADLPELALRRTVTGQTMSGKVKTMTYVKPNEERTVVCSLRKLHRRRFSYKIANSPGEEAEDEAPNTSAGAADVAEAALKDLEGKHQLGVSTAVPNTRSTLIIHASKKVTRTPSGEYAELANGIQPQPEDLNPEEGEEEGEEDSEYFKPGVSITYGTGSGPQKGPITPLKSTGIVTAVPLPVTVTPAPVVPQTAHIVGPGQGVVSNGLDTEERGRSRSRRRDFFDTIRRKFSRSKVRSKSVEPTNVASTTVAHDSLADNVQIGANRSISMERTSGARSRGGFLTVPISRGRSTPSGGIGSGDSGSTRSSLSGTSGLSSASTKTYINEASLLVVETLENGVIKHYLVPLSLQRKNKWRKKGTKLHIYNEHTFVAKHLSSSVTCEVCQKSIGRRLGKQGYECRDCSYKCHKPCHVKTDILCPNSTVNSMDLVYVKDERAEKKKKPTT